MVLPNLDWKSHKTTPLSFSLPYFLPISSFQKIEESFNLLSIYNFFYEMFFGNKWYHKFVSSFMATSFLVVRSSEGEKQENERQYVVWWTKTFKKVQPFSQEKLSSLLQLFLSCLNRLDKNLAGYCILNQGTFRYLFFAILSAVFKNMSSYFIHSPIWHFFQDTSYWAIHVGNLLFHIHLLTKGEIVKGQFFFNLTCSFKVVLTLMVLFLKLCLDKTLIMHVNSTSLIWFH